MSGIVGIVHFDGAPVDCRLLVRMTDFMTFRGPDADKIWIDGTVGFGHTLLKTTDESKREHQPFTLDGRVWIVADVRVDARAELIAKLKAKGHEHLSLENSDVELMLRAYQVWGEACVEHLIGDFAFAIWDGPHHRLFCGRDHFGVKPFYYVHLSGKFLFSNTLDCLRLHPQVSDKLNYMAVADFLLFELNQEPGRTTFEHILRIPPAHTLSISLDGTPRLRRYWTLPVERRIQYRRTSEYVEHFQSLFGTAVGDRLRTERVSIPMSGGLDSPSIAATAQRFNKQLGTPLELQAHTMVYDKIMPDRERFYSGLVAEHLGIPIHYQAVDDYKLFERWDQPGFARPEPLDASLEAIVRDHYARAASTARVALSGDGGDIGFGPSAEYLETLLRGGQFWTVARSAAHLWLTTRHVPRMGVRALLKRAVGAHTVWRPPYPEWLNPDLAKRLDLAGRWTRSFSPGQSTHPRQEVCASFGSPYWTFWFEMQDPGATREALEFRYPFFDTRLVEFLLAIPPIPWCVQKNLLRLAMPGYLPEPVRLRPKAHLVSDGISERLDQVAAQFKRGFMLAPELGLFVDLRKLSKSPLGKPIDEIFVQLRPLSLNWWLHDFRYPRNFEGGQLERRKEATNAKAV
jgi:asparagine synthase (glutamine-hydrolysing)